MAEPKPRCRLYLQVPARPSEKLEADLVQAIGGADPACVLLCHDEKSFDETLAAHLVNLAHERGVACLVEDDAELALRLGAEGIHIEADANAYTKARDRLGKEAVIGAACGLSRHDAMALAELGADYVAFGTPGIDTIDQQAELVAWWSEIFVVPCVVWNVAKPEDAARLSRLGADFVVPSLQCWQGDSAVALMAEMAEAIGQARRAA